MARERKPLRVLLVEDSEDDAHLELLELRRGGYDAVSRRVDTRKQLIEALADGPWDVVLCDHGLPAFSSREALQVLRDRALDVPLIIVSGQIGEDAAIEALKSGATDYVLKGNLRRLGAAVPAALREAEERARRRRAEQELRREESRRLSMVENALYGMCRCSAEGRLLTVNPALAAMLGYEKEGDLLGIDLGGTVLVDPAEWGRLAADCLRSGRLDRVESRWRQRDGKVIRVRLSATVSQAPEEGPAALDAIVEDVTRLRQLEEQYLHSQKMEAVGRLAGGVAHDFNNLLTVIQGYSSLLLGSLEKGGKPWEWMEEVRKASDRASTLTRQLLTFSRKQVVEPRVIDVNHRLRDLTKMLQRLVGETVRFDVALAPDAGCVRADPGQFDQVLANLVVNSRDAMPEGGTLRLETGRLDDPVECAAATGGRVKGPCVRISVADTGVGMDSETRSRIFEPFFTTKKEGSGTGLGLATVYAIVERCAGHVGVESEPGRGTTFRVFLPATEEAAEAPAAPNGQARPGGRETVLLAEDDGAVRDLVAQELREAGYTVLPTASGDEALALSGRHAGTIHAVLSDVAMPGISGRVLVDRLRAERPGIRAVLMSGHLRESDARLGGLPPEPLLLQKPFKPGELLRALRRVLDAPA